MDNEISRRDEFQKKRVPLKNWTDLKGTQKPINIQTYRPYNQEIWM